MAELNKVRLQVLDPKTGAVLDTVDVKTSDAAVYLQDGTLLRDWIANAEAENYSVKLDIAELNKNLGGSDALAQKAYSDVTYNEEDGTITFKTNDGQTKVIDTALEKLAVDFTLEDKIPTGGDTPVKTLVLTLSDGSTMDVPVTDLIDIYTGKEGTQIVTSVVNNEISATIVAGSITMDELAEDVLAAIAEQYELVVATTDTLGGVIVGDGLAVEEDGTLSANNITFNDDASGLKFDKAADATAVITVTTPTSIQAVEATVGTPSQLPLVVASTNDASVLSVQWFSKKLGEAKFAAVGEAIVGVDPTLTITPVAAGQVVYYAVVTETAEGVVADPVASPKYVVDVTEA